MNGLLIDTCAFIWLARQEPVSERALNIIGEAWENELPITVSPITAWEIGMLHAKGRLPSTLDPVIWIDQFMTTARFNWAQMPWKMLTRSSSLPESPDGDPADRIVAATAREFGYTLITRDKALLKYGQKGYLSALKC